MIPRAAQQKPPRDYAAMRRDSREALAICDRNDDRWGRAAFLANLGFVSLFGGGTLAEACARFEEARPLLRELGNFGSLVVTLLAPLSTIVLKQGDAGAAERYATEARRGTILRPVARPEGDERAGEDNPAARWLADAQPVSPRSPAQ